MTKEPGVTEWTGDEGPTRTELIEAVQTLIMMGACWLDRDREVKGTDSSQAKVLRKVVDLLSAAASVQREHAERVVATIVRDDIAAALGAKLDKDPSGGMTVVERKRQFPHLPRSVPGDFLVSQAEFRDKKNHDVVAHAIRAGVVEVSQLRSDSLAITEDAAQSLANVARAAMKDDVHMGPTIAASHVLSKALRYSPSSMARSNGRKFDHWLSEVRHADRDGAHRRLADLGAYFGARVAREFKWSARAERHPRAWAAASLTAEACGAGVELAERIFDARRDHDVADHVWRRAARGQTGSPAHESLFAFDFAMDQWRRGLPVAWPPDPPPDVPATLVAERVVAELRDAHDAATAAWMDSANALFSTVCGLDTSQAVNSDDVRRATIEAAVAMWACRRSSPVVWCETGIATAAAVLAEAGKSDEPGLAAIASDAGIELLFATWKWDAGKADAAREVMWALGDPAARTRALARVPFAWRGATRGRLLPGDQSVWETALASVGIARAEVRVAFEAGTQLAARPAASRGAEVAADEAMPVQGDDSAPNPLK
ncbi:MAG: hypothetical protein ACOYOB_20210 [Myxococcota bacterium]